MNKLLILFLALGVVHAQVTSNLLRDALHSRGLVQEREEIVPETYQNFAANYFDASADYDSASAHYTVPPVPVNNTVTALEFAFLLQSSQNNDPTIPISAATGILVFDNDENIWRVAICMCPMIESCQCSDILPVNSGDDVTVSHKKQNGNWTSTISVVNGVQLRLSLSAENFATMSLVSSRWAQKGVFNCNNLPSSNGLTVSNIEVMNRGTPAVFEWTTVEAPNICSSRIIFYNSDTIIIGWNSNSWTGNQPGACRLWFEQFFVNSWVQDGETYTHYRAQIQNWAYDNDLNGLSFTFDQDVSQIWNIIQNDNGSFSIPIYALPLTALSGAVFEFGYISTKKAHISHAYCEGGDHLVIGEQPNFVHNIPSSIENEGCSVEFVQRVANSWNDGNGDKTQINVEIRNTGSRSVTSIDFTSSLSIEQSWVVESLGNGHYGLPSWSSALTVGSSLSFGYIVDGQQAAVFQAEVTCY